MLSPIHVQNRAKRILDTLEVRLKAGSILGIAPSIAVSQALTEMTLLVVECANQGVSGEVVSPMQVVVVSCVDVSLE